MPYDITASLFLVGAIHESPAQTTQFPANVKGYIAFETAGVEDAWFCVSKIDAGSCIEKQISRRSFPQGNVFTPHALPYNSAFYLLHFAFNSAFCIHYTVLVQEMQ
jgi:hypothetical protein